MRARTLAAVLVGVLSMLGYGVPVPAHADGSFPLAVQLWNRPVVPGGFATAFKPGDPDVMFRALSTRPDLSVTFDLSPLGVASTTVTRASGQLYSPLIGGPGYGYPTDAFVIGSTTDGEKTILVTATDASGATATSTLAVTIDTVPPDVALTRITFSTTSPQEGDFMYLSGTVADTLSPPTVYELRETASSSSSQSDTLTGCVGSIDNNTNPLNAALATSTDGSFTDVAVPIFECGHPGTLSANADTLTFTLYARDAAGNEASSSLEVAIPKPPKKEKVDSVLFIPGTETSRLYYQDSSGYEHELWEPSNATEVAKLAMNPDGSSLYDLYVKQGDIIDHLYGNRGIWSLVTAAGSYFKPQDFEIYGKFEAYMDTLVASSTIDMRAWQSYPYDWRYDVRDIVDGGTKTLFPDGSFEQVYLEDVIGRMASTSATGKVAIVAHSNGGLIAKALLAKLEADGKQDLVDKLIMVGTPQWGTPTDLGAMVHGDGYTLPPELGLITYGGDVRAAAATMPGPYDLMPSPAYFAHVADPVATFDGGAFTLPFKNAFMHGIRSWDDLVSFATDSRGLDETIPGPTDLNTPLALSSDLLEKASGMHAALDAWTPPDGLSVTAIAGWGQLTKFSYAYTTEPGHQDCAAAPEGTACRRSELFVHSPVMTEDGDYTVVTPSAAGDTKSIWYFNSKQFLHDTKSTIIHQELLAATPVQDSILDLLEDKPINEDYLVATKPLAEKGPLTVVGARSPVNLLATDSEGNQTGIVPVPGAEGLYFEKHDIPGSAVDVSGEEKSILLPQDAASYTVSVSGYAAGPANLVVENLDADGTVTSSTTLADIPVTASSTGSFSVSADALSTLSLDLNGDGTEDASMTPQTDTLVSYAVPETAPESDAPEPPAPQVWGGAGGPSIPNGVLTATLTSTESSKQPPPAATTTATSTAPEPALATTTARSAPAVTSSSSTTPASTSSPVHMSAKTALMATPARVRHVLASTTEPVASATPLQTASAYDALSQAEHNGVLASMYHWVTHGWSLCMNFFARVL